MRRCRTGGKSQKYQQQFTYPTRRTNIAILGQYKTRVLFRTYLESLKFDGGDPPTCLVEELEKPKIGLNRPAAAILWSYLVAR